MEKERLLENIKTALQNKDSRVLFEEIDELHPADIVEILPDLEEQEQKDLFKLLPHDVAAEVLNAVDGDTFAYILDNLTEEKTSEILDEMSLDDVADILGELSESEQTKIIEFFDHDDATDIRDLMQYHEDTAGGIMTTEFVSVREDMTINQAIEELRSMEKKAETIYYVYVTDYIGVLVGVLSLREIIMSPPDLLVSEVMQSNVIYVNVETDQEEVAKLVSKYDLLAIPVVDNETILQGIITVDDILDVIEEEATEDIFRIAGTGEMEYDESDSLAGHLKSSVKSRLPWLLITLVGSFVTGAVISGFESQISSNVALVKFMPALTGMGGNIGTQSSTLTVRGIATGKIDTKEVSKILLRESAVGIFIGFICSICISLVAGFVFKQPQLGPIVGIAMTTNMLTAATIGTLAPLIFKNIGIDPAVASAPFISTTIDITGNIIYFSLVKLLTGI
ncbi:MAG TPA: magnesium transporter [Defluviitaleaceae bacterium]|nr:magnesium transporter [Defluviitaleaceae bacterium]HPT77325.1 magnesium transporter [Defluviitaleaceae bacterium]